MSNNELKALRERATIRELMTLPGCQKDFIEFLKKDLESSDVDLDDLLDYPETVIQFLKAIKTSNSSLEALQILNGLSESSVHGLGDHFNRFLLYVEGKLKEKKS